MIVAVIVFKGGLDNFRKERAIRASPRINSATGAFLPPPRPNPIVQAWHLSVPTTFVTLQKS